MIGAAIAVLARGAAKFRHGDHHRISGKVAQIDPEGGQRLREFAQQVGQQSLCSSFVDVMVPAAHIGKCDFDAQISLQQLRHLAQAVTEASARIIGARRRAVAGRISRTQHFHRFKSFVAAAVQHGIYRLLVHGFKTAAQRGGSGIRAAYGKVADIAHRHRGHAAGKNPRQGRPNRHGAEGRRIRRN